VIAVDAPRAGRREWIGLAVMALPCLLYPTGLAALNLAVPSLSADLQPGSSQLLWITEAALGGAVAAAEQLPTPLGAALLGVAREAFLDAPMPEAG
jgi:hypothetical protein